MSLPAYALLTAVALATSGTVLAQSGTLPAEGDAGWQALPDDRNGRSDWQPLTRGTERYLPSAEPAEAADAELASVPVSSEVQEFGTAGSRAKVGAAPLRSILPDDRPPAPSTDSGALPPGPGGIVYRMPSRNLRDLDDSTPTVDENDLDLFAGEVRVLGQVDVTRVAIGNGAIVKAQILDTGELLLIAQAPGSTSLRLWNRDTSQSSFNIRVTENDPVTRVRMERMVRMRVRLVEFRKSALGQLGIDWSDDTSGPALAIAGDAVGNNLFRPQAEGFTGLPNRVQPFSTYFGIASNITSRINFLSSRGDAVTIAEPVLSALNGGVATFLAGGEVPYPSVGEDERTIIEFKEYGIKLNIAPLIDAAGNVRTQVETEISQLDPAVSVRGVPGLLTRRATTEVNVRTGETIVISGLLSAESSRDVDRVPGLGRLPVIGALFRSKNIRNAVSELVIFVTPEVIEPDSGQPRMTEGDERLREDSNTRLSDARDRLFLMD